MATLRSSHKAGKTKRQAKSFQEVVSLIGQRTQLASPGYIDSTKLGTAYIWGRWTKYVDSSIYGSRLSSWTQADEIRPRFCQRVYDEPNYFTTSNPVDVCRNHLHYEIIWSFLEWSSQISRFTTSSYSSFT
jgi:hypothetical protein